MNDKSEHDLLLSFTYGIYAIGSQYGDNQSIFIANSLFQVSSKPCLFALSTHRNNYTTSLIRKSGKFSAMIISEDMPLKTIRTLGFTSGQQEDKLQNIDTHVLAQCPVLDHHNLGCIVCRVKETIEMETHLLFIGEVISIETNDTAQKPLTYLEYRKMKYGFSPKNSPTFLILDDETQNNTTTQKEVKYQCPKCGFAYEEAKGDFLSNIPENTPFSELPPDYLCPICGVHKDNFTEQTY